MRVLVVGLATFDEMTGGSARYLSGMIEALSERGHDLEVITAGPVVMAAGSTSPGALHQLRRFVRRVAFVHTRAVISVLRHRPGIVNVHFAYDGVGAVIAARLRRVPIVVMFQGPWAQEAVATGQRGSWPLSTRARRTVEKLVYRSASRCIVLSTAFRDVLADEYGVARSRIRVIAPGISLAPFDAPRSPEEARRQLGLPDRPTVVTVRRLVRRMGLDLLLQGLASIPAGERPHAAIAGSGPEREALAALVRDLGLDDDVTFLGRVPDDQLATLYAAGTISVVPTRQLEGFGYVVLESYAAGTPVLATSVGGLVDVVGSFDPDRLVDPTPEGLATGIRAALSDPQRLPSREACRAFAAQFAWDHVAPRVEAVFVEAATS